MNKLAKEALIVTIITSFIGLILLGVLWQMFICPKCQECLSCDCSQYQNNLTNCTSELANRPVIQNITYIDKPIEVPVNKDSITTKIVVGISFIFSLILTIKLFKIKINLPKELEDELSKIDKWIIKIKWVSLISTIILSLWIFFKLLFFLISF